MEELQRELTDFLFRLHCNKVKGSEISPPRNPGSLNYLGIRARSDLIFRRTLYSEEFTRDPSRTTLAKKVKELLVNEDLEDIFKTSTLSCSEIYFLLWRAHQK